MELNKFSQLICEALEEALSVPKGSFLFNYTILDTRAKSFKSFKTVRINLYYRYNKINYPMIEYKQVHQILMTNQEKCAYTILLGVLTLVFLNFSSIKEKINNIQNGVK